MEEAVQVDAAVVEEEAGDLQVDGAFRMKNLREVLPLRDSKHTTLVTS